MGKRKRRVDKNKTPLSAPLSDLVPHSSQMDSSSKEKSTRSVGTSAIKPLSSIMEIVDTSMKLSNAQHSPNRHHNHHHHNHHHHQNHLSRTLLLRHPRQYYGRQYSRRNSPANHAADTPTSHRKGPTPLRDEKLSFKLAATTSSVASQSHSGSRRPERIRSSSSAMEEVPSEVVKMGCGICQKLLKRKPSSDVSVVAVLVCGHAFHAECLEARTCHVDRRDPPCPLCVGPHSQSHGGSLGGQL